MRIKLDKIPNANPDKFRLENHTSRVGVYFWCGIDNGILDIGYEKEWQPVGKTTGIKMFGDSNLAILFENSVGETVWFHFFDSSLLVIEKFADEADLIDDDPELYDVPE